MRPSRLGLQVLAVLLLLAAVAAPGANAQPFEMGVVDGAFVSGDPAERSAWFDRATQTRVGVVNFQADWAAIAPSRPGDPSSPADPAYRWRSLDAAVRDASARRLTVLVTVIRAPAWAEGANRPGSAPPGSWRPDPANLGDFSEALARRYSGSYRPGSSGDPLPAVRNWQIWGEPNLSKNLSPQWQRQRKRWRATSPGQYRLMLNAAYDAIKRVDRRNVVIAAGTAPFGDYRPGGQRIPPVAFWRRLLCVSGNRLRPTRCPARTRLDAVAHNPYSVGSPTRRALNDDDMSIPDLGKLKRVLAAARRGRTVLPAGRKGLWVTEVSWDSSPPDPDGVPAATHARWLQEAMYSFWRQGANVVIWFQIRDALPRPSYAATNQSGLFLRDGTAKPAATAFRFPFVVKRGRRRARFWGRTAAGVEVQVERLRGSSWVRVKRARSDSSGVFRGTLGGSRSARLRASTASDASLPARPR